MTQERFNCIADGIFEAMILLVGLAVIALLNGCLPMHGNPQCFTCANIVNGTVAEDTKCWVGPCAEGQHTDAGPQ